MPTQHLRNISIKVYECFLIEVGCKHIRTKGGHYVWARSDLDRPIIFQSHINPVPEHIIRNGLKTLGMNKKGFFETLDNM